MGVAKPEDLHPAFARAFNVGDIDTLVRLYESQARLVPQPGQTVQGHVAVRQSLAQFLALKGKIVMTTTYIIHGEGLALLRGQWRLNGTGPDGTAVEMTGNNVEVARQQPDGTWLFTIDHAFGAMWCLASGAPSNLFFLMHHHTTAFLATQRPSRTGPLRLLDA